MADNRPNEMSSSSSPTTASSSPMIEPNGTPNGNDCKMTSTVNKDPLNAPKFGTPVPNRVFVGGIPTDTKEAEVEQLFSRFGNVVSVKIINDRAGVPRGYGFVTFESEEDANKVMKESDNLMLKNRKLNVSVAIKKQQHFTNDYNSRSFPNGSLIYNGLNPYFVNASNSLYPDFNIYTSDAIPFYNMGVNPQLMANSPITSPSGPYPYTYHTSGLYLSTQPSMNPQMTPQFQNTASTYPLVNTSFARMPITSQNMNPNMNVNQVNPYLQLSNTTPPPLTQPSSVPIQVGTVANPVMATTDSMSNALNVGMSSLSLGQTPLYAISNISNNSQAMACVQNVQLKADNGIDMCSDNSHLLSAPAPVSTPQMLELVPYWHQRVANIQSPNKVAMNRNQYSTQYKAQPPSAHDNPNARPDRRSNSSSNASHNRKSVGNSVIRSKPNGVGYGQNRYSNATAAENQCQTVQNHNSIPNPSAFQGMPFVKHQYNNRFHTISVPPHQALSNSQPPLPKMNGTAGQHRVTKIVNGVEIFAMSGYAGGDVERYGYAKTPPPLGALNGGQRRSQTSSQK